ncbi:MAG: hypothetical protein HYU88_08195, partial [Chloroflexi bacterium]|nr:hypothetical protein [Chloroflexota bacterium]
MGRSPIDVLLDQCVADVKAGRRTAAQCLADHADARAELGPLLRIALAVVPPAVAPDPTRKARARYAFVAALHGEKWGETRGKKRRPWWAQGLFGALPRLSVPALSALAIAALVLTTGGAAFAAQEAQPGEVLYGVKLAIEQVQVATATSDEARAQVYLDLAARRLTEVERAFDSNNPAAAGMAAEAHARALADAEAHLERAEGQGQPVDAVLARFEASIQRQQAALQKAGARADEAAQAPIERARERAQRGLERAKERASERGKGAGAAAATPAGGERAAGVGRAGTTA